jgi:hypothetical protein
VRSPCRINTWCDRPALYEDADLDETSHIEWFADGHGSLQVPQYNNGEQACWDTDLQNMVCP